MTLVPVAPQTLSHLGMRAVATIAERNDPTAVGPLPTGAYLARSLSHTAVLERAQLLVGHAGHGSVSKALWYGVPMVLVPWGRDQPGVAMRAERLGIARVVTPEDLALPEAIRDVVTARRYDLEMVSADFFDVIVIGAGHAGLATSQRLAGAGLDHVVLERGEVANAWRTQRWDSFTLNTPNWMSVLPGKTSEWSDPDAFATTAQWTGHLERYVRDNSLPIRTHTEVTSVDADESGFTISTVGGSTLRARHVVVAAGFQNAAKLPPAARDLDPTVLQITTAEYRRPAQLPPGGVLVVGSAQSGCQIAEDLLEAGREVYLATGKVGRLPRRLHGRDTLWWLEQIGWFRQRPQDLPDPAMVRWAQPQTSGLGPRGHTVSYRSLAARGATLLGHFEGAADRRVRFADDLASNVAFAEEGAARIRKAVEDYIARTETIAEATEPDLADEPVADPSAYRGPSEIDLADRGIRSVIFAVGFGTDLSWLHLPVFDERGAPRQVDGCASVGGVWFVGILWMRTRKSGIIWGGSGEDSTVIVDQIAARLEKQRTPASQ